jgi:hypothetical protein
MFDHERSQCWGYGYYDVKPDQVCDSYEKEQPQ